MSAFRAVLWAVILSAAVFAPSPGPSAQAGLSATAWTELHASRVRLVASRAKTAGGHYLARGALAAVHGGSASQTQYIALARFFAENLATAAPGLTTSITGGADAVLGATVA